MGAARSPFLFEGGQSLGVCGKPVCAAAAAAAAAHGLGQVGCHLYSDKYPWPWSPDLDTARLEKRFDALVPWGGVLTLRNF